MLYHLLFVVLLLIGYLFFPFSRKKGKLLFIIYSCLLLILQSGLRNVAVGADTYQYYNRFVTAGNMPWSQIWGLFSSVYYMGEGKDAGYDLLEKVFYQFVSSDYQLYLLFVAIFVFFAIGKLINRFCYNKLDVLVAISTYYLLFYSFFSITGIRQTLSVACSIHCCIALLDKKYFKFVLFFIPAFLIHRSAAIVLIFPFLMRIKNLRYLTYVSIVLFFVALFNRSVLINYFRELAEYDVYETRLPLKLMFFYFVICVFLFVQYSRKTKNSIIANDDLYSLFVPTFSCIPLLGWDSLFMREILFFSIYSITMIPALIKGMKSKWIYIVYILFCLVVYITTNGEYRFFWQDMQLPDNYFR